MEVKQPKKSPLQAKYGKYSMVRYQSIVHVERQGKPIPCSLCGKPYNAIVDPGVDEIICALCMSGLADSIADHKENYIDLEQLLDYVKNGRLAKFRSTNGLSRADLGSYINISSKYIQRIENLPDYPVDRLVKAIKKKIDTVQTA